MNNLEFVQLSKPKGRAYANNSVVSARENVKALSIQRTIDKFQLYNDSLYPINDNFTLITWETRFNITPLDGQTIEERTAVVKKKMDFPKGQTSRLSLDYIQSQLDYFGFSAATVYYNEEGDTTGYIHGNNYTASEKYTTGLDKYNSFIVVGKMDSQDDYIRMLRLLVSLKPLDCFIVDRAYYQTVLAIDATTILAVNGTQALLLNSNSNRNIPTVPLKTDGLLAYYDFADITTAALDQYSTNDLLKSGTAITSSDVAIGESTRKGVSGFTVSDYFRDKTLEIVPALIADQNVAISAWVKTDNIAYITSFICQIGQHNQGADRYITIKQSGITRFINGLCFNITDNSTVSASQAYPEFCLISVFFNAQDLTLSLFINGSLIAIDYNSTWMNYGGITIGGNYTRNVTDVISPFGGVISDVSIWSEFSLAKHLELYNNGDGLFLT